MKTKYILGIVAIATLAFTSCKKEGCTDEYATNYNEKAKEDDGTCEYTSMNVALHFHLMDGNNETGLNQNLTDDFGNTYQITRFDFYVSKPYVTDMDDTLVWSNEDHHLIQGPGHYDIFDYEIQSPEHWHKLNFGIGVSDDVNFNNPADYDPDNDLSPQSPSMHWNWNSGYRFIVIEGMVDVDGNQTLDSTFTYHIGTSALFRNVSLMLHENIDIAENKMISLDIDVSTILSAIDIANNLDTHTSNNLPLAEQIADNMDDAINKH